MRIIAGEFRGRKLHTPKNDQIRPTADRVREAVFSMIADRLPGSRVLDLFAGTGALGLEALSRGALQAVFVDKSPDAVRLIQSNIDLCRAQDRARVILSPAVSALQRLANAQEQFHLVFMDPPYGKGCVEEALLGLDRVTPMDSLIVAEHHVKEEVPSQVKEWVRVRERPYGDTAISFFERRTVGTVKQSL
jgi:16S rRNA (guanine(966)-N(2))-methyltransferase RsmD